MELIMTIDIKINSSEFVQGKNMGVCMIDFEGAAHSDYFNGKVIGTGVDTQRIHPDKTCFISARYMLEGVDAANNPCRIFIENNGSDFNNCKPSIVTNSPLLQDLEDATLKGTITPCDGGVIIHIYRL